MIYAGKSPVIYAGKSPVCLTINGWNLNLILYYWSNKKTMIACSQTILIPYVEADLNLSKNHPALVIFDQFKAQATGNFAATLNQQYI